MKYDPSALDARRAQYRHALHRSPRLKMLFFELTSRCNLACKHCGSNCSPAESEVLCKEDVFKVLRSVENFSPRPLICLSGGEPFLHPEFFAIARRLKEMEFDWGITTNGTLIDEEAAKALQECRLTSIAVSLDGDAEAHNDMRGATHAFDRCIAGIKNLVKFCPDAATMVTTVVHRGNLDRLDRVYEIVSALGVDFWRITNVEPIGRARDSDMLLKKEELEALFDYIVRKKAEEGRMQITYGCSHFLAAHDRDVRDGNFLCGAGITVASVLSNGDYYACLDIRRRPDLVQGNVKRDDFAEAWNTRFAPFRHDRSDLCAQCLACESRVACAGDSAHTWDFDANRPLYCMKCWGETGETAET